MPLTVDVDSTICEVHSYDAVVRIVRESRRFPRGLHRHRLGEPGQCNRGDRGDDLPGGAHHTHRRRDRRGQLGGVVRGGSVNGHLRVGRASRTSCAAPGHRPWTGSHVGACDGRQRCRIVGVKGGLTALADNDNDNATMWTVVLNPCDADASEAPLADIAASCDGLACGSRSMAPVGTIAGYDWDFGDGSTDAGRGGSHLRGRWHLRRHADRDRRHRRDGPESPAPDRHASAGRERAGVMPGSDVRPGCVGIVGRQRRPDRLCVELRRWKHR